MSTYIMTNEGEHRSYSFETNKEGVAFNYFVQSTGRSGFKYTNTGQGYATAEAASRALNRQLAKYDKDGIAAWGKVLPAEFAY